ncbi:MAG TPA: DUF1844 domain-containing protein [Pyrinomonadaceae bacterium]|nr:DUF1844 domain-containing protein [Pyrinomonadaceae bacterium]
MNEDQPNFKVTDRRLFNADGTLRDVPEEEKPAPKPESRPETKATASEPVDTPIETQSQSEPEPPPPPSLGPDDQELTAEELADAQDPASFISFVMSIASNAASALGMMEHPVTHQREVDPELGKHWIDVLGMLQKKTAGNLTPPEKNMIEGLLHDLRMQYVALTSAVQKPRTFTGSDITGGR